MRIDHEYRRVCGYYEKINQPEPDKMFYFWHCKEYWRSLADDLRGFAEGNAISKDNWNTFIYGIDEITSFRVDKWKEALSEYHINSIKKMTEELRSLSNTVLDRREELFIDGFTMKREAKKIFRHAEEVIDKELKYWWKHTEWWNEMLAYEMAHKIEQ